MKQVLPPHKGINAAVFIGDKAVGGQLKATLNRTMTPINITNKINGVWNESLSGLQGWSITCNGMFIKDDEAFQLLEQAFYNGTKVTVRLTNQNKEYYGEGLITNFPIATAYDDAYTYNITILGVGKLNDSQED